MKSLNPQLVRKDVVSEWVRRTKSGTFASRECVRKGHAKSLNEGDCARKALHYNPNKRGAVMSERPTNLVPHASYAESKNLYRNSIAWRRFANRAQRHPFMKEMLLRRDFDHGCSWCRRRFSNPETVQVHHTTYNNVCTYECSIEIATPTGKRPNRKFKGPDCEGCFYENRTGFDDCAGSLVLVHKLCNQKISLPKVSNDVSTRLAP